MEAYDLTIGLDDDVWAVVYEDPDIGDIYMTSVGRSEADARTHWRFKSKIVEPGATRIDVLPYREFIKRVYMKRSANPFETIERMKFLAEIGLT